MTKADGDVIAQAESLHVGLNPPEVRTYLSVNKELLSHKHRDPITIDSRPEATRKKVTRDEKTNVKATRSRGLSDNFPRQQWQRVALQSPGRHAGLGTRGRARSCR
jgi:hypothetical protein